MSFTSIDELLHIEEETKSPLWEIILDADLKERNVTREASLEKMSKLWHTMLSASHDYNEKLRSASGLSGGDGALMRAATHQHVTLCGDFIGEVMSEAISMAESNACMKRIVAAPTAGSCGVLPAVLIPFSRKYHIPDEKIIQALYISAAFGEVIASRAYIAGAQGGCQAEIGAASGMAAAALVYLKGGTSKQSATACAFALKSLLGLVCDPIGGLVEVPCVKRNVIGAVNALTSADMALAGIQSAVPVDEVIDAMKQVGDSLPFALKETSLGGLAATPTAFAFCNKTNTQKTT